ncbi:hypothetical protein G6O67_000924 [Ophiocordyceps sinensis]|uniref:DUF3669 domain-containing protein n=2 Tax=Ophiocordyceps sinensis TaxID=72228 RepID=A0A8H4Q085_9HYPO|nr:hypothetical protein OCS_03610 [Ophiocordyceps sinensis CO18]KAF4513683.1 hypothetical protein G6O67_000924 [Ophiocordyceps sinensis]
MASREQSSTYSTTSSLVRDAQFLSASELDSVPGQTVLQRCLSVRSVISTSSSFAVRYGEAASRPPQQLVEIGIGLQGVILEQGGKQLVFKKELAHIVSHPSFIWNVQHEHLLHLRVIAAFDRYCEAVGCLVRVPRVFDLILPSDEQFWADMLPKLPEPFRQRTTTITMERLLPLPKVVRRALVREFSAIPDLDDDKVDGILAMVPNKHCLARTCLGVQDRLVHHDKFTLRNMPLWLKRMQLLAMDTHTIASQLGMAYALMHWGACIDGDDVEFVLGTSALPSTTGAAAQGEQTIPGFQHRAVGLYLIDFGQCSEVDLSDDVDVVYQRFRGIMVTGTSQDYIPHCHKTPDLFAEFARAYVDAGNKILADKGMGGRFDLEWFVKDYQEYAEDFLVP